jgi:hypothetical protein
VGAVTLGEVAPTVARALVRFDNGDELEAPIIRTEVVDSNYFLVFAPEGHIAVGAIAVDDKGHVLGERTLSEEVVRRLREVRRGQVH